jgi:hypothetical protein
MYSRYKFITNLHSYDENAFDFRPDFKPTSAYGDFTACMTTPQASQAPFGNSLSLEDILNQIGLISDVQFDPFQPKQPQQSPHALLPFSFPQDSHPFDYFSLFFTPTLFETISRNTNQYASQQKLHIPEEKAFAREWKNMVVEELGVK